jgi:4-amino-4-deoxy-L-arabinose transferase-like glycosyltransferase
MPEVELAAPTPRRSERVRQAPSLPTRLLWGSVLLYTVVRLAVLPAEDLHYFYFHHDSFYIAIIAENLQAGRGYVNDAHWLVFLQPDRLPIPYHNANPLYPTLVAGVAAVTGLGPVQSSLAVSALASGLLFAALLLLARKYVASPIRCLLLAAAGTLFYPVFDTSLDALPDGPCAAFAIAGLAFLVRSRGIKPAALAGALFGLAWLSRSSVILMIPAVAVYLLLSQPWRRALVQGAAVALAALLVASPWLIHTAVVWGNPLRSDASYYLMQDYHSVHKYGHPLVERYWHSPERPESLGQVLRREPAEVIRFALDGVPMVLDEFVDAWSYEVTALAVGLKILVLLCAAALTVSVIGTAARRLRRRRAGTAESVPSPSANGAAKARSSRSLVPEVVAALVFVATDVLVFALRPYHFEARYHVLVAVLFALFAVAVALGAWDALGSGGRLRRIVGVAAVAGGAVFWGGVVPVVDVIRTADWPRISEGRIDYLELARHVNERFARGAPVVVGFRPYFYTLVTGAPSLSIPESNDAYLLDYMRRYHARYVFLARWELNYWRPGWLKPNGLPPGLRLVADLGTAFVYERRDGP